MLSSWGHKDRTHLKHGKKRHMSVTSGQGPDQGRNVASILEGQPHQLSEDTLCPTHESPLQKAGQDEERRERIVLHKLRVRGQRKGACKMALW